MVWTWPLKTEGWSKGKRRAELLTVSLGCCLDFHLRLFWLFFCIDMKGLSFFILKLCSDCFLCSSFFFLSLSSPLDSPPSLLLCPLSHTSARRPSSSVLPQIRPNMNFWQELGSVFYCQRFCECPHKSDAVMPLKRLPVRATKHTQTHSPLFFSSQLYLTFLHFNTKHMHILHTQMCEWGLWDCLCSHQIQQPQCLFAISTGSSPLHQTHGNLWISIFSKSSWASECMTEHRKSAVSAAMSLFLCGISSVFCTL